VTDPWADKAEALRDYGVTLCESVSDMDCIILAVAHNEFRSMSVPDILKLYGPGPKILIDVKGICDAKELEKAGVRVWRL